MEKLKYVPLVLLCFYGLKSLIIHPTITEVGVLALLCGVVWLFEVQFSKKIKQEVQLELDNVKKDVEELKKLCTTLTGSVSAVKVAQGFKLNNLGQKNG